MDENLKEAIDKVVLDKTLSLQALETVKAMQEQLANMEAIAANHKILAEKYDTKFNELVDTQGKLGKYQAREDELLRREKEITAKEHKAELKTAVAEAKAATYHTCFDLIFKNTITRESTLGSIPIKDNAGYIISSSKSEDKTITKE